MNEAFDIEFRGDHVHVEFGPAYTADREWMNELWNRLKAVCDEHGTKRVLAEGILPAPNRPAAAVIEASKKTAMIPNLWLAFYFEGYERNMNTELYEAVADSNGVRVKFFDDRDQAMNWLMANAER
ncbi:MAG TPA: hypothetical protein VJV05_08060 [Pyrinomonadaceae bacterium]|nr:hypothetical protein [Pyrinomonadaceae bacterium]